MAHVSPFAFAIVIALAVALPPRTAIGQTTTATVQGVVKDASPASVPGVTVTLREQSTGFVRATTTDGTGTYEMTFDLAGFKTRMTVSLSGTVVTLTISGQSPRELEPAYGTTFRLKGLTGYTVRFEVDGEGRATGIKLSQPNGVYFSCFRVTAGGTRANGNKGHVALQSVSRARDENAHVAHGGLGAVFSPAARGAAETRRAGR